MMDKLISFAIIAFCVIVCYATSASAITCYSCSDEITCQRTSQYNVTKDCTGACVTIFSGFVPIKKSCVSDLTTTETELCNDSTNPLCYKCTQANCNNLGRTDHKCIACTSANGEADCFQDPTKIAETRCPAPTTDEAYCFVTSVGNVTTRGCITSTRQLQSCSENSSNCNACPVVNGTNACNSYPVPTDRRKCISCSGTNCMSTTSGSRYCTNPNDSCVSLNNYGSQIQGCASDITVTNANFCKNHKHSCVTCNSNDCNSAVPKSPEDYRVCFSCEGISCQRSTLYTQTTDCEKSDTCVTLFENFIPIKKTCYADLSSTEKTKCDTNNPLCAKCSDDRCNNFARVDHKCLMCSTSTNANCLQNPKSLSATRCRAPISDDAYCFTKSVGNVVTRGCLNTPRDIATCAGNNQQCSYCSVTANSTCNTNQFPSGRRQCHFIRGANPNSLSTSQSKYCAYATDTCLIIKSNGTLSQIFSREMNSTEVRICDSNHECCSTCSSNNCNTQIPSYSCGVDSGSPNGNDRNFRSPLFIVIVMSLTITVLMNFSRCVIR